MLQPDSRGSDPHVRASVRARLASGALLRTGPTAYAGNGTGKPCIVCAKSISDDEIEHEIAGPTTVWAHWDCYSIWRQESDALARTPQPTPLHIRRGDGDGIDPPTAVYTVSFGGSKDRAGAVLLGRPLGLDDLTLLLRSLGITASKIETACQVLTEQPHYVIPDVLLTPAVLRRFRL